LARAVIITSLIRSPLVFHSMLNTLLELLGYALLAALNALFLSMFAHVAYSLLPLPRTYPTSSASLRDIFSALAKDRNFSIRAIRTTMLLSHFCCLEQLAMSLFGRGVPDGLMSRWWLGWLALVSTIFTWRMVWKHADWKDWHDRLTGDTWAEFFLVCYRVGQQWRLFVFTLLDIAHGLGMQSHVRQEEDKGGSRYMRGGPSIFHYCKEEAKRHQITH
jgi:hypothetical protein